jgi:ankyrin repeat protein
MLGAAFMGADSIVELLASKGADLNCKDMYGQSPLSIAYGDARLAGGDKRFRAPHAHKTTAELLLKLGAAPVPPPQVKRAGENAIVDETQ